MVKDLNDPTNVDTIPAMLTEGEFVLNKEATAMYGPIIEQMNNHGLQQRHAENQMLKANIGKKVSTLVGSLRSFTMLPSYFLANGAFAVLFVVAAAFFIC